MAKAAGFETAPTSSPRLTRAVFATLYATVMIGGVGSTVILSALPALGRTAGLPDILVGGVFALSALAWAITSPLWSRLSDRIGRRPLLIIGLAGGAVSMIMFGGVTWLGLQRALPAALIFIGLLLSRGMNGMLASAAASGAQAYVADHTVREDRTRSMAALASSIGLGTVIGPALVPVFGLIGVNMALVMVLVGLVNLVLLCLIPRLIPSDRPGPAARALHAEAENVHWLDARIRPFLIFGFLMLSIQAVNSAVLGFTIIDRLDDDLVRGQQMLSLALLGGAAATLVAQWGLIPLLRLRSGQLIVLAPVAIILGSMILWLAPGSWGAIIGHAIACLGFGMGRPGYTSGASLAVGPSGQGVVAGLTNALTGGCSVLAPMLGVAAYGLMHGLPFLANFLVATGLFILVLRTPPLFQAGVQTAKPSIAIDPESP